MAKKHHLAGKPKSVEHRARIAATTALRHRGLKKDDAPDQWQAEYDIALFALKRRMELAQAS